MSLMFFIGGFSDRQSVERFTRRLTTRRLSGRRTGTQRARRRSGHAPPAAGRCSRELDHMIGVAAIGFRLRWRWTAARRTQAPSKDTTDQAYSEPTPANDGVDDAEPSQ